MQKPPDPQPMSQDESASVAQPIARPYHKPQLTVLGDIKQLTQAVGPNGDDGSGLPPLNGTS